MSLSSFWRTLSKSQSVETLPSARSFAFHAMYLAGVVPPGQVTPLCQLNNGQGPCLMDLEAAISIVFDRHTDCEQCINDVNDLVPSFRGNDLIRCKFIFSSSEARVRLAPRLLIP